MHTVRRLMTFAIVYGAVAFTYSLVAFVSREPAIHFHEYSYSHIAWELTGHVAFGIIAASPLLDVELIVLSGLLVIAMDTDHILAAFHLATSGRPAHSFMFIPISFLTLAYAARKFDITKRKWIKVAFLAPIVFLSHIAYDVFAAYELFLGKGASFPLLAPLSFSMISFPYWTWIAFECGALLTAVVVQFGAKAAGLLGRDALGVDSQTSRGSSITRLAGALRRRRALSRRSD